jgi:hypothetical protein
LTLLNQKFKQKTYENPPPQDFCCHSTATNTCCLCHRHSITVQTRLRKNQTKSICDLRTFSLVILRMCDTFDVKSTIKRWGECEQIIVPLTFSPAHIYSIFLTVVDVIRLFPLGMFLLIEAAATCSAYVAICVRKRTSLTAQSISIIVKVKDLSFSVSTVQSTLQHLSAHL